MTIDELKSRATITIDEAAAVLGLSRGAMYQAARTAEIPTLKFGRRIVVPVVPLLALLGIE